LGPDLEAIVERFFKAAVFVPIMVLVAWWLFSGWMDRALSAEEAGIGLALTASAFFVGVASIASGGWGFLGVIGLVFCALLALAVWQYVYWRRHERDQLLSDLQTYEDAIERDPSNAAAYSFLGEVHLRLRNFDEATAEFEKALELDPESGKDRKLLQRARERRAHFPWTRLE
jgi:tetratricopeptide (TPR) repeat protein